MKIIKDRKSYIKLSTGVVCRYELHRFNWIERFFFGRISVRVFKVTTPSEIFVKTTGMFLPLKYLEL